MRQIVSSKGDFIDSIGKERLISGKMRGKAIDG
jgi:hypothetical protein